MLPVPLPCRVWDCYVKDDMAANNEKIGFTMLRTGVVPEVGMGLYLQVRGPQHISQ